MKTVKRDIASAVIISKDNKIIMGWQDSSVKGIYPNCWHIPGGGVEKGETTLEAMRREVFEEVGIDISKYDAFLLNDTDNAVAKKQFEDGGRIYKVMMRFYDYKVLINDKRSKDIEVKLTSDLIKFKWFDIKDLSKVKLTPPSQKLFKKLGWL